MNASKIINAFESKDSQLMWEATWEILRCKDTNQLTELLPHIKNFKKILSQVDMGGALHKNKDDTELAFSYIAGICGGKCRCNLLYVGQNFFNPERESTLGFISAESSKVMKELYEQHYEVTCASCNSKFKVREVHGWHVPWYEWLKS